MITTSLTGNLGNHMWYYVICRIVADKLGYEWGINPQTSHDYFNGKNQMDFMNVDFGISTNILGRNEVGLNIVEGIPNYYSDKQHIYNGDSCLINMYDENVFKISDNTMVHLISQSEDYIHERRSDVLNWFSIKQEKESEYLKILHEKGIHLDENMCVINFRGGEYQYVGNLIPAASYWENCIKYMRNINPLMKFIIISDDPNCASRYIPGVDCHHVDVGFDFYVVNKSKYLILANSTFSWWASWLNQEVQTILAPKYWGRFNVSNGYWSLGDSYTRRFLYMDREGKISNYETCKQEALDFYEKNNLL